MTLVYCWSHLCRGFYDQAKTGASPIAMEARARIAAMYRIEAHIRGKDAAHRLVVRQAKSQTLVADLYTWFQTQAGTLPARGPTAQAIGYALKHWDGLGRFLHDGGIEMDTNTVERAMRPVAPSRKNALFAGSDEGAASWAAIASLIETCKLNAGVPPVCGVRQPLFSGHCTDTATPPANGWFEAPNTPLC